MTPHFQRLLAIILVVGIVVNSYAPALFAMEPVGAVRYSSGRVSVVDFSKDALTARFLSTWNSDSPRRSLILRWEAGPYHFRGASWFAGIVWLKYFAWLEVILVFTPVWGSWVPALISPLGIHISQAFWDRAIAIPIIVTLRWGLHGFRAWQERRWSVFTDREVTLAVTLSGMIATGIPILGLRHGLVLAGVIGLAIWDGVNDHRLASRLKPRPQFRRLNYSLSDIRRALTRFVNEYGVIHVEANGFSRGERSHRPEHLLWAIKRKGLKTDRGENDLQTGLKFIEEALINFHGQKPLIGDPPDSQYQLREKGSGHIVILVGQKQIDQATEDHRLASQLRYPRELVILQELGETYRQMRRLLEPLSMSERFYSSGDAFEFISDTAGPLIFRIQQLVVTEVGASPGPPTYTLIGLFRGRVFFELTTTESAYLIETVKHMISTRPWVALTQEAASPAPTSMVGPAPAPSTDAASSASADPANPARRILGAVRTYGPYSLAIFRQALVWMDPRSRPGLWGVYVALMGAGSWFWGGAVLKPWGIPILILGAARFLSQSIEATQALRMGSPSIRGTRLRAWAVLAAAAMGNYMGLFASMLAAHGMLHSLWVTNPTLALVTILATVGSITVFFKFLSPLPNFEEDNRPWQAAVVLALIPTLLWLFVFLTGAPVKPSSLQLPPSGRQTLAAQRLGTAA